MFAAEQTLASKEPQLQDSVIMTKASEWTWVGS
jgi:hypothetical protein